MWPFISRKFGKTTIDRSLRVSAKAALGLRGLTLLAMALLSVVIVPGAEAQDTACRKTGDKAFTGVWEYAKPEAMPRAGDPHSKDRKRDEESYRWVHFSVVDGNLEIVLVANPDRPTEKNYRFHVLSAPAPDKKNTFAANFTGGELDLDKSHIKLDLPGGMTLTESGGDIRMTLKWSASDADLMGPISENDFGNPKEKGVVLKQTDCGQKTQQSAVNPAATQPEVRSIVLTSGANSICPEQMFRQVSGAWTSWMGGLRSVGCDSKSWVPQVKLDYNSGEANTTVWLKYQERVGNDQSFQTKAVCFPLAGSATGLSSLKGVETRFASCAPPVKELRVRLKAPQGRDLQKLYPITISAMKSGGEDRITFTAEKPEHLFDAVRPDSIRFYGDPDLNDDSWTIGDNDTYLEIPLKTKNKTIRVKLSDEEDPSRPIPRASVDVTIAGTLKVLSAVPGESQTYSAQGELVRGDVISLIIHAPEYGDNLANITYEQLTDGRFRLKSTQRSVSIKPVVKVGGIDHPINVRLAVNQQAVQRDATGFVARLPRAGGGSISIMADDAGSGYFRHNEVTVAPPATSEIRVEVPFARPILSVVYNPNSQLLRIKGKDSTESDLNASVWNLFQSLASGQEWRNRYSYRYFFSTSPRNHQQRLVSAEDNPPPSDTQTRQDVLAKLSFNEVPLPPDAAIGDMAEFLSKSSFPASGRRGFLVYIMGALPEPVLRDDPRFDTWDKMLGDAHMMAVIAAFTPAATGNPQKTLTTERHHNLRYLEFAGSEEAEFYFQHAFADIHSAIADLVATADRPSLTISSSRPFHPNGFKQGQSDARYDLKVTNSADGGPTNGRIVVTEVLPPGMKLDAINGYGGWTCKKETASCERSDSLEAGRSFDPVSVTARVSRTAARTVIARATVTGGNSVEASVEDPVQVEPLPHLSITSSHAAFRQGQRDAVYTLKVSNAPGAGATNGTVTVTEKIPQGLEFVRMSGQRWDCSDEEPTCSRTDGLKPGQSYEPITVTVNVRSDAPVSLINQAVVENPGILSDLTGDATDIAPNLPKLVLAFTGPESVKPGQAGVVYQIVVKNSEGAPATAGTVTLRYELPTGLKLVSIRGDMWDCKEESTSCTRSDSLAGGASYSQVSVTVDVTGSTSGSVKSLAVVSGGGASEVSQQKQSDVKEQ